MAVPARTQIEGADQSRLKDAVLTPC